MKNLKNPFVIGLLAALSLVVADILNHYVAGNDFQWQTAALAAGIAVAGYIGKFFSGSTNTILAIIGSSLVAIIPMIQGGDIDWVLIILTFVGKILGVASEGLGAATPVKKD